MIALSIAERFSNSILAADGSRAKTERNVCSSLDIAFSVLGRLIRNCFR